MPLPKRPPTTSMNLRWTDAERAILQKMADMEDRRPTDMVRLCVKAKAISLGFEWPKVEAPPPKQRRSPGKKD